MTIRRPTFDFVASCPSPHPGGGSQGATPAGRASPNAQSMLRRVKHDDLALSRKDSDSDEVRLHPHSVPQEREAIPATPGTPTKWFVSSQIRHRSPSPWGEGRGKGDRRRSPEPFRPTRREPSGLPRVSPLLLRLFRAYARRFVAKHFHAVRMTGQVRVPDESGLVVFCNHASWWDPMMLFLGGNQIAPSRRHYAPVDARAIERYPMFKRMGLFGVEQGHRGGAARFLRISQTILNQPNTALWITPQGRFADVRERPVRFQRGLGVLAARCRRTLFVPVAMEYTFWEERLPEALIHVGQPIWVEEGGEFRARMWTRLLEQTLLEAQDRLAGLTIRRDAREFRTLLSGTVGVNRVYDLWRAMVARLQGRLFQKEHGNL